MATVTRVELVKALADMIIEVSDPISFCILEVGAAPLEGHPEPFYQLLDIFPGSHIVAFEVDDDLCDEQNRKAKSGLQFFPVALGRTEEKRKFYMTAHPMCSSLYQPNEELIKQYCGMDMAILDSVSTLETISLDKFVQDKAIGDVDFIKIDIQGAELDVFQGGVDTLRDVVMIVSEVEFIPLYINQPLFGDVCAFLMKNNFMFQNYLKTGRRALNPFIVNDPNKGSHFIWSDALFIKNILQLPRLGVEKLLKMSVLATIYGSDDLAYRCLSIVDSQRRIGVSQRFVKLLGIAP